MVESVMVVVTLAILVVGSTTVGFEVVVEVFTTVVAGGIFAAEGSGTFATITVDTPSVVALTAVTVPAGRSITCNPRLPIISAYLLARSALIRLSTAGARNCL